jgi:hypothetical protein
MLKALLKKYGARDEEHLREILETKDQQLDDKLQELKDAKKKEAKYEARDAEVRAESRKQFIDGLKKEGKLLPRHEKVIASMLEIADGTTKEYSYELGEGEQKGTLSQMMKSYLSDMLKLVEFEELSKKAKEHEASGRSAQLEVEKLADKYEGEGKAETRQAAYELVKKDHPEIWKAYMSGKTLEED